MTWRARCARALDRAVMVSAITCSRAGADPPWEHELRLNSPSGRPLRTATKGDTSAACRGR